MVHKSVLEIKVLVVVDFMSQRMYRDGCMHLHIRLSVRKLIYSYMMWCLATFVGSFQCRPIDKLVLRIKGS